MKVSIEKRNLMQKDIQIVVNYLAKNNYIFNINDKIVQYSIWNITFMNRKYSNDNGNVLFIDGYRLLERVKDYCFYPDGSNDDSIETTLSSVFKCVTNNYYKH